MSGAVEQMRAWAGAAWRWLLEHAEVLRQMVEEAAPGFLKPLVARLSDEAVIAIAAVLALVSLWGVWKTGRAAFLWLFARKRYEAEQPVRRADADAMSAKLADQQAELAAIREQLNRIEAQRVAAGAAPLGAMERERRDEAVAEIVAEQTPAANAAARELAEGDVAGAIATLERDARADVGAAAEKWRRLGALVMGVDTAKARAAYEEAFKLQPDHFWTCVELARLRDRSGDLDGARTAAECAVRAARGEREQTVADSALGDVLVKAGDLAGAKSRFEASLAVSERLAAQNPGSAEAQRDVSISLERLGDVLVLAGDLAGAKSRFEASLAVRERLAAQNPGSAEAQRDVSVSMNKLGDVLVKAGDLAGAKSRFEASLAVSERLAAQNPGSAEAQRDLIVSYVKMAEQFPKQGWAGKALRICEELTAARRLAPADAWMLEDLRKRAAADS